MNRKTDDMTSTAAPAAGAFAAHRTLGCRRAGIAPLGGGIQA